MYVCVCVLIEKKSNNKFTYKMSQLSDKADVHFAPPWHGYLESVAKTSWEFLRLSREPIWKTTWKKVNVTPSVVNDIQSNCLK